MHPVILLFLWVATNHIRSVKCYRNKGRNIGVKPWRCSACMQIRGGGTTSSHSDAYSILNVPRGASQEAIKKQYRKLCLKYHPDKNVEASPKERERCEEAFKLIQRANSQIGDLKSRMKYDQETSALRQYGAERGTNSFSGRSSFADPMGGSPFHNAYRSDGFANRGKTRFYVNGIDVSDFFSSPKGSSPWGFNSFGRAFSTDQNFHEEEKYPKSIFQQDVVIPLDELYEGAKRKEFQLKENPIRCYAAAFRGGIAGHLAIQGLCLSFPVLLRTSFPVSLIFFATMFHMGMPRPNKLSYATSIEKGWKNGTKLIFNSGNSSVQVVFILREGKHDRFIRVGNNLKTTVTVGQNRARKGCTVFIQPLCNSELPIAIKLKSGLMKGDSEEIIVKGRGWPIRTSGGKGDLIVKVNIVSDTRAKKIENKMQRKARKRGN